MARRAALAGAVVMALTGAPLAQDRPDTQPVPRPLDLAALQVSATTAAAGATADVGGEAGTDADPANDITAASTGPADRVGSVTGFPIPRFVSLKAAEANARRGPSRSHRIDWVFQRRHMPVMVVAEHGHWRRIIDRDGAGGWIHYTLLSGERTAIVDADMIPIYQRPDTRSMIRAEAERGVIGTLRRCRPDWCEMEVGGYRGWVQPATLWGVDAGETFD